MSEFNLLFTAGVLFLLLAGAGALALRLKQSVIPAYIIVGILVGPYAPSLGGLSLTLVDSPAIVRLFAELGVVLLLFFVGLELSLDQVFANRTKFLWAGVADVGISLPLGVVLGLAFGFTWLEAGFIALIVFNSSTVIIAKSLIDLGWIADPEGQAILGVVVIEDVLTALGFALLSVFLLGGTDASAIALSIGQSLLFLVLLLGVAYYGATVLDRVFETRSSEIFVLGVLGVGAFVAGAGLLTGVSEAVAAFLVGTAFGRTGHAARIERLITPSRDLFAALFFLVVGLQTDPALLTATFGFVLVVAAVTTVGQLVSGFLAGRAYGLDRQRAVRVGCALTPRGEFSLVIAAFLVTAGTTPVLRETIPAFTVGYVLVTSILGTVLMRNADRLSGGLQRVAGQSQ
ncbi:monovalent cation:H+ antiporter-2, CPA2 family [Halogranum gelatinilyticum]|uniref:Monovalent cation:H+ antiporter-2, CPA2 family n=1 Tax=Halogranum gelatinilyticum TaxID=660521 RepID=A0A1G9YKA5_9EURY|nr:cation:proton antiporter [Halogranum gelatinilyticum]SDN09679.1 monovalent cation:H+ antiporter-2, CPA2 family [Halogranum gelatinilyticum]